MHTAPYQAGDNHDMTTRVKPTYVQVTVEIIKVMEWHISVKYSLVQ